MRLLICFMALLISFSSFAGLRTSKVCVMVEDPAVQAVIDGERVDFPLEVKLYEMDSNNYRRTLTIAVKDKIMTLDLAGSLIFVRFPALDMKFPKKMLTASVQMDSGRIFMHNTLAKSSTFSVSDQQEGIDFVLELDQGRCR